MQGDLLEGTSYALFSSDSYSLLPGYVTYWPVSAHYIQWGRFAWRFRSSLIEVHSRQACHLWHVNNKELVAMFVVYLISRHLVVFLYSYTQSVGMFIVYLHTNIHTLDP